ncbi:MAG: pyridoxal-phosphate dependent enzyme [Candidatus Lokiarchaeota archaeon]
MGKKPLLFEYFPNLDGKIPWTPILTNQPTPVERLENLENYLKMNEGKIYIKRDDKIHKIYGGNKLRKFEFIFGDILNKKKKGVITIGGIGTNHGLACAIVCNLLNPSLKCDLFLYPQPLTWHVQRSLLLFNQFGARLHLGKSDVSSFLKALKFQFFHPKYYLMFPGGSPMFRFGTPLGIIGFINAIIELKQQIDNKEIQNPDIIFIPAGSTGTAAGLLAGIKLCKLKIKLHIIPVYPDFIANPKTIIKNSTKAIKYLRKFDKSIPKLKFDTSDFEFTLGYLGSDYGIKTAKSQNAVDLIAQLEEEIHKFKLETTYTGKAAAAMIDFLRNENSKDKRVLFWNTYNSNNLDRYLKQSNYNYKSLPQKFHKFFEEKVFQCWQIEDCKLNNIEKCPAFMNYEYRCWKVKNCPEEQKKKCKKYEILKDVIILEK